MRERVGAREMVGGNAKTRMACIRSAVYAARMGSQQSIVDAILLAASGAGDVSARKMFGEHALYCDGKLVALICDDQLFVKPTDVGRRLAGPVDEAPPYPGAKPCLLIPADRWSDGEWVSALIQASATALPPPKRKSR